MHTQVDTHSYNITDINNSETVDFLLLPKFPPVQNEHTNDGWSGLYDRWMGLYCGLSLWVDGSL